MSNDKFKNLSGTCKVTSSDGHLYIVKFDSVDNPLAVKEINELAKIAEENDTNATIQFDFSEMPKTLNIKERIKNIIVSIRYLQEKTGASLEQCKDAIIAAKGDVKAALKILRNTQD